MHPGGGLYVSTLLTVRPCTIMYCTYMHVFSMNKILFKPSFMAISLVVEEKKIFKVFNIYEHGGHLGHPT